MSVFITAVHMEPSNGTRHEHIDSVRWQNPQTLETGQTSRSGMVDWINRGGQALVADGQGSVRVIVIQTNPPHIRTVADGRPTDNLLSLPRF